MISATIPSAKYSCSRSPLRLSNGSTAIDGRSCGTCSDGSAGARVRLSHPQLVRHIECGLEALAGLFLQAATDNALEIQRQVGAQARERGRAVAQDRRAHVGKCFAGEWSLPGRELVDQDAEREQVRARIH